MRVGTSYKQHAPRGSDAIVIGSGIGGLATASLLARVGHKRVLVLERHYTAGGFTHTFNRRGYEWDVGVHYIGELGHPKAMMSRVFTAITDGTLEWADLGDVYDTVVMGGEVYEFVKGRERFRRRMHEYFPSQRSAIDRYLAELRKNTTGFRLFAADKALPNLLSNSPVGGLLRAPLLRSARRTTHDVMSRLFDDPRAAGVLTGQWGDYGLTPRKSCFPIHGMVASHFMQGGAYPVGGSSRMAASIVPVIEAWGGDVLTNVEVERIDLERGRAVGVTLTDGNQVRAPLVISDAGVPATFGRLLPPEVATRHGLRLVEPAELAPSCGHLSLYVGLEQTAAQLDLPRSNMWIFDDHRHDENLARFEADPEHAPLPVTYLSFASAKDPDFERRHPGRATLEVITMAQNAWFQRWADSRWKKRGDDYEALKASFSERMLDKLYTALPQLRGRVAHHELSTPLSTRTFTGHAAGEIYGLECSRSRFEARALRPRTRVPGLFLTGADALVPGVGGAVFGGLLAASAILGRNPLRMLAPPGPLPKVADPVTTEPRDAVEPPRRAAS